MRNLNGLLELGWEVLVIWECETAPGRGKDLQHRLEAFLAK